MSQPPTMPEVHAVARLCLAQIDDALALLSGAPGLARWNLGMWQAQEEAPGLLAGTSLFGGGRSVARVEVDVLRGSVDYRVGTDGLDLVPRIQARVQPGSELGYAAGTCVVTLMAWRSADMDDARWHRLQAVHAVEIEMIRAALEHPPAGSATAAGAPA